MALADRPLKEAAIVTDSLTAAGVLTAARSFTFAHPLVAAAVYQEVAPGPQPRVS